MFYLELNILNISVLITVGIITGFINVMAGSGSFLTLPVMIFLGIPAPIANGTNRIAILLQNVVSSRSFYKHKMLPLKTALLLSVPSIIGSLLGAWIAVDIDKNLMEIIIGVIMLIMLFFILYKPEKWLKSHNTTENHDFKLQKWHYLLFFLIGIYGGFIQAGVGIFLLSALVLAAEFDIVKANAIKAFINLLFTPFALFVFIINNQVDYSAGLILSLGSIIGAYIATKSAVKWGAVYVRWILIVVILASSVKLLFF